MKNLNFKHIQSCIYGICKKILSFEKQKQTVVIRNSILDIGIENAIFENSSKPLFIADIAYKNSIGKLGEVINGIYN